MQEDWFKHVLYGFIYGDCFGFPYEERLSKFLKDETIEWKGFGAYVQPAGTFGYPTSLMLATIHSLKQGFSDTDIMTEYTYWQNNKAFTQNNATFFIPSGIDNALRTYQNGVRPYWCGNVIKDLDQGNTLIRMLAYMKYDPMLKSKNFETYARMFECSDESMFCSILYSKLILEGSKKKSFKDSLIGSLNECGSLNPQYEIYKNRVIRKLNQKHLVQELDNPSSFAILISSLYALAHYKDLPSFMSELVKYGEYASSRCAVGTSLLYAFDKATTISDNWNIFTGDTCIFDDVRRIRVRDSID